MSTETAERTTLGDRFLTQVELAGIKLPQPFNRYLILFLVTGVVSTGLALADVAVTVPGSDEPIVIKGLFTGEGLAWFTADLGANYIGFLHRLPAAGHDRHDPARDRHRGEDRIPVGGDPAHDRRVPAL